MKRAMKMILQFIIVSIIFLGIDAAWVLGYAESDYTRQLENILRASNGTVTPMISAGIVSYVLIVFGILYFVVPKGSHKFFKTLFSGAIYGIIVYGVFTFTNLALLKEWQINIAWMDVIWGAIICAVTSIFAMWINKLLFPKQHSSRR